MLNPQPEKTHRPAERGVPEKEALPRELPEIKELKERIEKLEARLEKERIPEEKEKMVKREIKSYLEEMQKIPAFAPPPSARDEAEEIGKFPSTQQVGTLVSLVFERGLHQAISVARALDNPAVLDEFHDVLVDRYYEILVEKGILKLL